MALANKSQTLYAAAEGGTHNPLSFASFVTPMGGSIEGLTPSLATAIHEASNA